ncbi:hypothetical protein OFO01_03485 [Campylobacter sp. JMF_01 NE2]|uniref:hypothetical protein n=1 Tax=unclassified Campylobacter TaxID=2593542 RepID=UPI0022E9C0FB|nr:MULTISPECIES: hypothetical protein [unclassified Campylobacter]MDA3052506.1 hypothetical protein [Campylobacter sp. JMF_03 NE3]MDA3066839.1 hypothetical protein [Campylobacter sp. JMF_01 NE2]
MQTLLVNSKISKSKQIKMSDLDKLKPNCEFLLYSDNILEGISLLNLLTENDDYLKFYGVVYEPIDQPIYIFCDENKNFYSIKICGSYDKWNLPDQVNQIKSFVDLSDYILYSINSKKVILAGENTETASVGNSQWQREGRKLGASRIKVPYIYQTFYSGKDESQDTTREPTSLQVYNQLVYSARYKVPSFVAYFESNFENARTRIRNPKDSKELFINYIKSVILADTNKKNEKLKFELEKEFFKHMISYLKEPKFSKKAKQEARLIKDFPIIDDNVKNGILADSDNFVNSLLEYIYDKNDNFINKYSLLNFDYSKFSQWNSYCKKPYIKDLLSKVKAKSYISRSAKIGIANATDCLKFLTDKFSRKKNSIKSALDISVHNEAIIFPLRIHKISNGKLTFSPDPESGEIVAFSELFAYDIYGNKIRPVIGYCYVETPNNFDFEGKKGSKLYKAISNYVDILIFNNNTIITSFDKEKNQQNNFFPSSVKVVFPNDKTEEVAIVSTYLNQSTIKSDWKLCFIHTHHSSWQQIAIENKQEKIHRISTKLDLIMQQNNKFMLAEGKNKFIEFLRDDKIKKAFIDMSELIDVMYKKSNIKFDTFIFNLDLPPKEKDPYYFLDCEINKIKGSIERNHFKDIANNENFVVIIVYLSPNNETKFALIFSENFNINLKNQLIKEFL